ncbi:MAG: NAD(P)/FAD-dependent oxidoreductase [Alphaproteobacteria bacterium]
MMYDVIIVGAGAAGLMCAIEAGKRGRRVLLLDKAAAVGEKIRISGGGRCNFTNIHTSPKNYLSSNPHFCISALKRYTAADFITLVEKHGIAYHEKTLGQLFCDGSSKQIIAMLLAECDAAGVIIRLNSSIEHIEKREPHFRLQTQAGEMIEASSLVVATGGPSIPKMGASGWGYRVAQQFGLHVVPPRPALVPLTLNEEMLEKLRPLAGIALPAIASCRGVAFREGILFTHRGLSGPAILQISSYWQEGDAITLNLLPDMDMLVQLKGLRQSNPKQELHTALSQFLPKKLACYVHDVGNYHGKLADFSNTMLEKIAGQLQHWVITPNGSEGFRTAEVTLGGVDVNELSSSDMQAKKIAGLYFIGEVVDVTGHLGGFNFQWAWSSGHAAGLSV